MVDIEQKTKKADAAYKRIENDLRERIRKGHYAAGTMLPSRRQLANEYGVALATAERGISMLLQDGTLSADEGRGTFVATSASPKPSLTVPTELSLRQPETLGTLGIISCASPPGAWHTSVILSVEKVFSQAGGSTRFYDRAPKASLPVDMTDVVMEVLPECSALVIIDLHHGQDSVDLLEPILRRSPIPIVYVTGSPVRQPILQVYYDNFDAGYQAAQHLLERGCQDLLFVAPYHATWVDVRVAGIQAALGQDGNHTTLRSVYAHELPWPPREADGGIEQYRQAGSDATKIALAESTPDGIIGANDLVSEGVALAARQLGCKPGQDFALVGFDDIPESRLLGITSLRPPLEELGQEAAHLALQALQGRSTGRRTCLNSHLMIRDSSSLKRT